MFDQMKKDTTEDFSTDEEVKKTTVKWLREIKRKFFRNGFRKLVPRYDKCLQMLRNSCWLPVYVGNKTEFFPSFLFFLEGRCNLFEPLGSQSD
ncbi:hypothetical protein WH47_02333 [Habropoda laboriosa]|uniref:Histone-lysine N-methyltransferase SETMAR n=1 Tax=Habropoda laboriosa TaxID=597456 RepID=A0A0L7QZN2_9HYME|nr:hypothetical protein WH47_02333 [Habropoda laboriosa]